MIKTHIRRMDNILEFRGISPTIDPEARVHPLAVIIGDVHISRGAMVWPKVIVRGEGGPVEIGERSLLLDGCVVDGLNRGATVAGDVIISPKSVVYGADVPGDCLLGPRSILLEGSVPGRGSVICADTVLPKSYICPDHSWVEGYPPTVKRSVSEKDLEDLKDQRETLRSRFDEHGSWLGLDAQGGL